MRNRYVMVLGTYGRWEYAWTLAVIPLWIFITVVSSRVDGEENFLFGPGWAFIGFLPQLLCPPSQWTSNWNDQRGTRPAHSWTVQCILSLPPRSRAS